MRITTELPLDRAELVAMLAGVELAGVPRSRPRRESRDGYTYLYGDWPTGIEMDSIGVAVEPAGPVVLCLPLPGRVTAGTDSAHQIGLRVEGDGSTLQINLDQRGAR